MKILLISLYFPPSVPSTGMLMELLFKEVKQLGHEVTVITAFATETAGKSARLPWWRLFSWEKTSGLQILRLRVPAFGGGESTIPRTLNYITFNLLSFVAALLVGRKDIIFTPSPPLTNGITAWLIGFLKRVPTVYNVQDLVPEAYIQFGVLKNPTLIRFFEWIEKLVYRKNTHISVISESFAEHLRQKGVPSKKISVMPNFVDVDEIAPLPRHNELSKKWGLDGKFVVMHAGSIAYRHGVEVLVDAAKLLVHEPEILFFVVGGGSKRHVVEARAKEANLQNFRMMGYVEWKDLRWLRASADVQMIVLRRGMTSHSVPCKVYEIMASARPFVAAVDEGSTICEIVKQSECGIAVTPESPREIADAILQLYRHRERGQRMAENGRREAVSRYSALAVAKQYDELFRRIVAGSRM